MFHILGVLPILSRVYLIDFLREFSKMYLDASLLRLVLV